MPKQKMTAEVALRFASVLVVLLGMASASSIGSALPMFNQEEVRIWVLYVPSFIIIMVVSVSMFGLAKHLDNQKALIERLNQPLVTEDQKGTDSLMRF